jgi:hypothetical protein
MRMSISGFKDMILEGDVSRVYTTEGGLEVDIRLASPVGWEANVLVSRRDVCRAARVVLRHPLQLLGFMLLGGRKRS